MPDTDYIRAVINAEAETLAALARSIDHRAQKALDLIHHTANKGGTVLVTGIGKSGLIGAKISATLASLGVPSHTIHPTEALHGDLGRIRPHDLLLALSYSGETEELITLAEILKQDGLPIITITKGKDHNPTEPDGHLATLATAPLSLGTVTEAPANEQHDPALAPTCSTTATLALGDALALAAARRRAFSSEDFARRHPGGALGGLLRPVTELLRFRVGENLPVVDQSLSVRKALETASAIGRRPGALIITGENAAVTGIFTDADLRRLVTRDPAELDVPLQRVMTTSPRTLPHTALVRDALHMVREHRQDEIPVVDHNGAPVGMLDVQDLMAPKLVNNDNAKR